MSLKVMEAMSSKILPKSSVSVLWNRGVEERLDEEGLEGTWSKAGTPLWVWGLVQVPQPQSSHLSNGKKDLCKVSWMKHVNTGQAMVRS